VTSGSGGRGRPDQPNRLWRKKAEAQLSLRRRRMERGCGFRGRGWWPVVSAGWPVLCDLAGPAAGAEAAPRWSFREELHPPGATAGAADRGLITHQQLRNARMGGPAHQILECSGELDQRAGCCALSDRPNPDRTPGMPAVEGNAGRFATSSARGPRQELPANGLAKAEFRQRSQSGWRKMTSREPEASPPRKDCATRRTSKCCCTKL